MGLFDLIRFSAYDGVFATPAGDVVYVTFHNWAWKRTRGYGKRGRPLKSGKVIWVGWLQADSIDDHCQADSHFSREPMGIQEPRQKLIITPQF